MNSSGKGGVMTFEILHRYLTVFLMGPSIPHSRAESSSLSMPFAHAAPNRALPGHFRASWRREVTAQKGRAMARLGLELDCPEQKGSGPPAREVAFGSTGQHVLEQAAKKKLFRPGGKEENAERK